MSNQPTDDERRQYFRIKNKLLMSYFELNSENDELSEQNEHKNLPQIKLLNELSKIESENTLFCRALNDDETQLIDHLSRMNKKIAAVAQNIMQTIGSEFSDLMDVDISGGGLRFETSDRLKIDQQLRIEIILLPEYQNISVLGQVVNCERDKSTNLFQVSITFIQIQENDRDAIIGHVFKTQSKRLRATKESEN